MDDNVLPVNLKLGFVTFQFMFGKISSYRKMYSSLSCNGQCHTLQGIIFGFNFSGLKVTYYRETNTI